MMAVQELQKDVPTEPVIILDMALIDEDSSSTDAG